MKSGEIMLLERCEQGPVSYTHAPNVRGKGTKLVRSTLSPKQQAPLHALALGGYLAEKVNGDIHEAETTITFSITALGRDQLYTQGKRQRPKYAVPSPTESKLERESREPV